MVANIWVAAADDQKAVVEQHIASGKFSANSKDENGYSPIHAAVSYGHIDLLQYLIDNGGDINIQDNEGDTPLHHVEDLATATYLVEKLGADYKLKNKDDLTAAQYIESEDEYPEIAQYLFSLVHDQPEIKTGAKEAVSGAENDTFISSLPVPGNVDGHQIRYTMEQEEESMDAQLSPEELEERRKKLEAILTSENPEEALRELVENAVHEGMLQYQQQQAADEPTSKKLKQ